MTYGARPGSIQWQIGWSLNAIRDCVTLRDASGLADHLALLLAIAAPKLPSGELDALWPPAAAPGRDRDGAKERALFETCIRNLARLTCHLSDHGLYAYQESPIGDASGLALRDPDDSEAEA